MTRQQLLFSTGLVLTVLFTGGCAKLFTDPPTAPLVVTETAPVLESAPMEIPVSESQDILDYFHGIQDWTPERFSAHLSALEKAYAVQPDDALRMRLAIALGFGRCADCKPARAISLFNEVRDTAGDGVTVALASLCIDLLEAKAKITATNRQLAKERKLVKELQQKLDALTLIEESLHQRE